MQNLEESLIDIKKFLKKLRFVIDNQKTFSLFGKNYVDKLKIDDVWVCFEASLPKEYKHILRLPHSDKFASVALYHKLKSAIKQKSILFPSCYAVSYTLALNILSNLIIIIDKDLRKLFSEHL